MREALFSMLASRLGSFDGLRAADLYAGSGGLGFEALSRGAAHVTFPGDDVLLDDWRLDRCDGHGCWTTDYTRDYGNIFFWIAG